MLEAISYIFGAVISVINIWWMNRNITGALSLNESKARLNTFKNVFLRYFVLLAGSLVLVKFAEVNIIIYGLGLLAGQIVIIILQLLEYAAGSKGQE
jgi:hypothetical protein